MVLVDTSVWSLALRRQPDHLDPRERRVVAEWADLVRQGRAQLMGPIRQEILRVRYPRQFALLDDRLSAFPDAAIEGIDYVRAARFYNLCRDRGVAGTAIDLLICAVVHRVNWAISSVDDFERYGRVLPIRLHRIDSSG